MKNLLLPVVVLLLVPALLPPDVSAEEERPLPIALENVELLPIQEIEWGVVACEHPELVTRLMVLGKRLERVAGHLEAREDPADAGSRAVPSSRSTSADLRETP